jgi:hypothetical protein
MVLAAAAGELVYQKFWARRARVKRAVARRPAALGPVAEGVSIRATGGVRATEGLLQAPITGRSCVAYHLRVGSGRDRVMFTLFERRDARTFSVADASGPVVVDMSTPFVLALANDISEVKGPKRDALFALIESYGISTRTWLGLRRGFWFNESALAEGQNVSVAGISVHEVHPDGQRPDPRAAPERLVLRGTDEQPLLVSDDDPAP